MKHVVLYINQSVDGFIADRDDSINWFGGQGTSMLDEHDYFKFIKKIDTVVMGRHTYQQIVNESSPESWPYSGMQTYVLSKHPAEDTDEIKFVQTDASELIEKLRAEDGKNIWIVGGATIINQLVDSNLIDIYCLATMPILLGGGKRLFDGNSQNSIKLQLMKKHDADGIVTTIYQRRAVDDE